MKLCQKNKSNFIKLRKDQSIHLYDLLFLLLT